MLSKDQIEFLALYDIPLDKVFDARGLSKSEYESEMKKSGKQFAYNVTPCEKYGHKLRSRSGHCIQCNPSVIDFIMRHDSNGIVYIAGSKKGQIIKAGYTKAISIRDESLNRTKYASFNDWKILFTLKSLTAGKIESELKSVLLPYKRVFYYEHVDHQQKSDETYSCSYSKAKAFIIDMCKNKKMIFKIEKEIQTKEYEFRNLKKLS
ncbi:MAG TPA: hypothetical protein PLU49_13775 [Saprospiraceae bacterium]|nr:hypothetical protein [Saprospiraceae bacterium]